MCGVRAEANKETSENEERNENEESKKSGKVTEDWMRRMKRRMATRENREKDQASRFRTEEEQSSERVARE